MPSTTQQLRAILEEGFSGTQREIAHALSLRGIIASQSQISRLLHKVGAVKVSDTQGSVIYRLPHEVGLLHELTTPGEKHMVQQWILQVSANASLVIIHTTPGAAGMIARVLDQHRQALGILGSIAGDDTIFVAPKKESAIPEILPAIRTLFSL